MAPSTRRGRLSATATAVAASPTITTTPTDADDQPRNTPSYYLLKSEPHEFSIYQLEKCPDSTSEWDGIRNYQARNILRTMQVNDLAWFYHSSCKEPGIVGRVRITRTVQPDSTALQPNHKYYDAKSTPENCRWDSVQIQLEHKYSVQLNLSELRSQAATAPVAKVDGTGQDVPSIIAGLKLLQTTRLSVQPVTPEQWNAVEELIAKKEKGEPLLSAENGDCKQTTKTTKKKTNGSKRASKQEPTNDKDDDPKVDDDVVAEKKKKAAPKKTPTQGKRKSKRTKTDEES